MSDVAKNFLAVLAEGLRKGLAAGHQVPELETDSAPADTGIDSARDEGGPRL